MVTNDIVWGMEYIERLTQDLGDKLEKDNYIVEDLGCPHIQPKRMRDGYAAIYIFAYERPDGCYEYLKIGKANQNSNARFVSQHYGFSAPSTLAKSICADQEFASLGVNQSNVKDWMLNNLHRINVLIKVTGDTAITELVEAVLHYRFRPRFEGNIAKK